MKTTKVRLFPFIICFVILILSCEKKEEDTVIDPIWTDIQGYTDKLFGTDYIFTPLENKMIIKFIDNFDTAYVDLFASSYNINFIEKFEDYNPYAYYGVFSISQGDKLGKIGSEVLKNNNVEGALPLYIDEEGNERYIIPEYFLVKFNDNISSVECEEIISVWGLVIIREHYTSGLYSLSVPAGMDVFDAIRQYMGFNEVKYTCQNEFVKISLF